MLTLRFNLFYSCVVQPAVALCDGRYSRLLVTQATLVSKNNNATKRKSKIHAKNCLSVKKKLLKMHKKFGKKPKTKFCFFLNFFFLQKGVRYAGGKTT